MIGNFGIKNKQQSVLDHQYLIIVIFTFIISSRVFQNQNNTKICSFVPSVSSQIHKIHCSNICSLKVSEQYTAKKVKQQTFFLTLSLFCNLLFLKRCFVFIFRGKAFRTFFIRLSLISNDQKFEQTSSTGIKLVYFQ